ncbi:MAG TPA: acetate/propionate family kinase [Hyphomicrobiaceae bacterium]|nr:acetate/propionate family kinase [Hyphomicrobiaceae bacterium]
MTPTILVLNAGSSSIKFQSFAATGGGGLARQLKGQMEGIGSRPRLLARNADGRVLVDQAWSQPDASSVTAALDKVIAFLRATIGTLPTAIGHRVVHGGPNYSEPTKITAAALSELERLSPLAPLHQPHNVGLIRLIRERQPQLLQVACFDTAFHRGHAEVADRYAIPETFYVEGVRRYGFHGLSYEYIARHLEETAPEVAKGRIVVAHLGSGASMCAIQAGKSVESTMGFTALDGLPMGTRPGQLDAGVVLYLINEKGMDGKAIENLLYNDCGLKALSGVSNDVRVLLESSQARAKLALDYFVHRVQLSTGMLVAAMGGIDAFVFTAGIGENAASIRAAILRRLSYFGLKIDEAANASGGPLISQPGSGVPCYVIPTDEELMIARHTLRVWQQQASPRPKENRA